VAGSSLRSPIPFRPIQVKSMKQNEVYAAIALAMHEFMGNNVHDVESGIITIKPRQTEWNSKMITMTDHPRY